MIARESADPWRMSSSQGLARSFTRVIATATAVWSLGLVAKIAHQSAILARPPQKVFDGAESGTGAPAISATEEWAGFAARALETPATLAVAALAALALGSLIIVARGSSNRCGATVIALALYGALALSSGVTQSLFASGDDGVTIWQIGFEVVVLLGMAALGWRWIEEVALAAALGPREDPHAIDAKTDREAAEDAERGPSGRGFSRHLNKALGERKEPDAGLSGAGSPIPRVMPEDD